MTLPGLSYRQVYSFYVLDDGKLIILQAIGFLIPWKRSEPHGMRPTPPSNSMIHEKWKIGLSVRGKASSFMKHLFFGRKPTWHFPARINILFDKFQCDRDTLSWWPLDGRRGEFKDHWVQIMFLSIYLLGIRLAGSMTGGCCQFYTSIWSSKFFIFFVFLASPTWQYEPQNRFIFYFQTLLMAMPFFKCLNGQLIYIPNSGLTDDVGEERKNWA